MTVTIETPYEVGPGAWLVKWSSDEEDPTYYVYRDGVLTTITMDTEMTFAVEPGEEFVIEVLDDADEEPLAAFPGRVTLHWGAAADTDYYLVEEYVDGDWTERDRIYDLGEGYFNWTSRFLEDATTHNFRITPVGDNGNTGTASTLAALMVRHPTPPDVSYSYSSGTAKVTIAAA